MSLPGADGPSAFDDIIRRVMREPLDEIWQRIAGALFESDANVRKLMSELETGRLLAADRDRQLSDLRHQADWLQGAVAGARAELRALKPAEDSERERDQAIIRLYQLVIGLAALTVAQFVVLATLVLSR